MEDAKDRMMSDLHFIGPAKNSVIILNYLQYSKMSLCTDDVRVHNKITHFLSLLVSTTMAFWTKNCTRRRFRFRFVIL